MDCDVVIIGGGASALMFAALLPPKRAVIVESNSKLGAKIAVSGGGKCNITNTLMGAEYFFGDAAFITTSLKAFDERALIGWLMQRGLTPVIRKKSQYFCEHSSKEILEILIKESRKQTVALNEKVLEVSKKDEVFWVQTEKKRYAAKHVVVASGGLSFPKLGASGIGYEIASTFGHSINKTAPALVGFTVQKEQFFFKELSGTSMDVRIDVGGQICEGALLFTYKGLSGPAVLDASLYWEKGKITIDFLPSFYLKKIRQSPKLLSSNLPLPKRVAKAFLLQLALKDKPCNQLSDEEIQKIESLQHYVMAPAGTFGYAKAEVTKGGVSTLEVNHSTMMSQKQEGLYFIGEVLDVTGRLGGYNFQWAFSSAFSCAKAIRRILEE